eukprot:COSAG06_NODE_11695_length_1476_cov_2.461147_1_plen_125_part_10
MSADDALAVLQRLHDSGALAAIEQQHATAETDDSRPAKRSRSSPPSATAGAAAAGAAAIPQLQDDGRWSEVLKRCSKAVVVIRCARVRAFDACEARFGHATGFVVDKRRGLILTNRHVVTDGPVT